LYFSFFNLQKLFIFEGFVFSFPVKEFFNLTIKNRQNDRKMHSEANRKPFPTAHFWSRGQKPKEFFLLYIFKLFSDSEIAARIK